MKAIVYHEYGPPEVLRLEERPKPTPFDGEVLVRVQAAAVNAADWRLLRGSPLLIRLMGFGLLKPKHTVLGSDVAGTVEAVGAKVTQFLPGDEVFGDLSASGFGAFAEYVCVSETALVAKPAGLSFEEAAAIPLASLAALHGLRDKGGVRTGQKVLINGASGGVGTFAVQIAKALGAEVTGVCSTRNLDMVRSIGADHVTDYTQDDITQSDVQYDLIVDAAAFRSPADYLRILAPGGSYVIIGGAIARTFQVMLLGPWIAKTKGKRMIGLISEPDQKDLRLIKELVEAGKLKSVIDRRYPLGEVPEAIRYVEQGHACGKVVIDV